MRRFLCIYLPFWSYDVFRKQMPPGQVQTQPELDVFVRRYRGELIIERLSPAAHRQGIQCGTPLCEAQAKHGCLSSHPFLPNRDKQALLELAQAASWLSPLVGVDEVLRSDKDMDLIPVENWGIIADITGTERVHGSLLNLYRRIYSCVPSALDTIRIAIAPTLRGAWALSRFSARSTIAVHSHAELQLALAELPIQALSLPKSIEITLERVGISTLQVLQTMPPRALSRRFGYPLVERLHQCRGIIPEAFYVVPLQDPQGVAREFTEPLQTLSDLSYAVREVFEELIGRLSQQGRSAKRYTLHVVLEGPDGVQSTREHVFSFITGLAQELLAGAWVDEPLGPWQQAGQVLSLSLQAHEVEPQASSQRELFSKAEQQASSASAELFHNLARLVGRDNVLYAEPQAEWLPERSFRYRPLHLQPRSVIPVPPHTESRPSRLFSQPQRVEVRVQKGLLQWGTERYRIASFFGPERISPPWWEDHRAPRDYFQIATESGLWLWSFRQGDAWFVHGAWG